MFPNNSNPQTLYVKCLKSFKALKEQCDGVPNFGAISKYKKEYHLNVNGKFPEPFLEIIKCDPRYTKYKNGKIKGGSGTGYIGGIPFTDEHRLRSYLHGIGLNVIDCGKSCGAQGQSAQGQSAQGQSAQSGPTYGHCSKLNQIIKDWFITSNGTTCFKVFYDLTIAKAKASNQYFEIKDPKKCMSLFPEAPGVYVVKKKNPTADFSDQIVYVGMTGKFNKNGDKKQKNFGLKQMVNRKTPYRFSKNGGSEFFEFGQNYSTRIDLNDLVIDCFTFDPAGLDAPAFLEAAILQLYLLNFRKLPAANKEF